MLRNISSCQPETYALYKGLPVGKMNIKSQSLLYQLSQMPPKSWQKKERKKKHFLVVRLNDLPPTRSLTFQLLKVLIKGDVVGLEVLQETPK